MKLKYSLFALIALAVAGCQKAPVYDDVVYIAGAEGEVPTLSLTLDDQFPKELSVKVSSSIVVGHDTKVRLVTDPSKIEEYNTQYGKKGVMLPETNFVLKNTELTIPAGSFSAAEPLVVSVTKDEGLKEGVSYVIPLSIESVDGDLKVKEGFRTVFVEIGRIIIGPAADCSGSTYFKVDFAEGEQDKYDIYNLGEVTYEARINLQRWGGWCNTVMGLEENFCLRFVQDDFKGQLQLSGWGGTLMVPTGGIAVSLNKWTHVAAVFDGPNKKVSIYIDGVLACSADTNKTSLDLTQVYQDDSFRIANSCNDGRQLKGYISEARVWAKALNGNDLKNNMCYVDPATDGLLAYWRFNEKADGKKVLPESDWVTTDAGKVLKSLGKINSYYALKTYGVNAQPYYVLQGRNGKQLVPPRGYDLNVDNFVGFLKSGVEAYNAQK